MTIYQALQEGINDYNVWIEGKHNNFLGNNPAHYTGIFYNKLITRLRETPKAELTYQRIIQQEVKVEDIAASFDQKWRLTRVSFHPNFGYTYYGDRKHIMDRLIEASKSVSYTSYPDRIFYELEESINKIQNFRI